MEKQNRLKSPVLWSSLIAAIALLLKGFGIYEIENSMLNDITNIVLTLLTAFGIINNPVDKANF